VIATAQPASNDNSLPAAPISSPPPPWPRRSVADEPRQPCTRDLPHPPGSRPRRCSRWVFLRRRSAPSARSSASGGSRRIPYRSFCTGPRRAPPAPRAGIASGKDRMRAAGGQSSRIRRCSSIPKALIAAGQNPLPRKKKQNKSRLLRACLGLPGKNSARENPGAAGAGLRQELCYRSVVDPAPINTGRQWVGSACPGLDFPRPRAPFTRTADQIASLVSWLLRHRQ